MEQLNFPQGLTATVQFFWDTTRIRTARPRPVVLEMGVEGTTG
jgi:hypothetical protein